MDKNKVKNKIVTMLMFYHFSKFYYAYRITLDVLRVIQSFTKVTSTFCMFLEDKFSY